MVCNMKISILLRTLFFMVNISYSFQFSPVKLDAVDNSVRVTINDLSLTLDNGLLNVSFDDSVGISVFKGNRNIVDNLGGVRTFYLDYYSEGYKTFVPTKLEVIEKSDSRVHVAYIQEREGELYIEYHLIMESDLSGIYSYAIVSNPGTVDIILSEMRTVYRFDPTLMKHLHNGKIQGVPPLYKELNTYTKVQDETWELPNGTYYSKYDFAGYIRESNFWGVFGGGYGAWVLTPSHEYNSGGPLKQDLLVHQDSLMLKYFTGAHFGTPEMKINPDWSKIYGPWLVYINEGSDSELVSDAQKQAETEKEKWPYNWVQEDLYPLTRATVTGQILGQTDSMVVLSSSLDEDFDLQTKGYLFYGRTDDSGTFNIRNVRPGTYILTAYPLSGDVVDTVQQLVTISESVEEFHIGNLTLAASSSMRWAIGKSDRRSSEFRYSNEERNYVWHTLEPQNLTFVVGESDPSTDWFYAQTIPGTWTIRFEDSPDDNPRRLILSIAGATKSTIESEEDPLLSVSINGVLLGEFTYENDKAIYRGALQSGNYHLESIDISASLIKEGFNEIELTVVTGAFMYDIIHYS